MIDLVKANYEYSPVTPPEEIFKNWKNEVHNSTVDVDADEDEIEVQKDKSNFFDEDLGI